MRLIDADELKTAFPTCDNSKPVLVACVRATIDHMPTIEPSAQPYSLDEWCEDCKEYDHEKHCCPRYNRVIRDAMKMRKRVKWIQISPAGIYECSVCGQNVMTSDIEAYLFCHGCGADLSEGGEDA